MKPKIILQKNGYDIEYTEDGIPFFVHDNERYFINEFMLLGNGNGIIINDKIYHASIILTNTAAMLIRLYTDQDDYEQKISIAIVT